MGTCIWFSAENCFIIKCTNVKFHTITSFTMNVNSVKKKNDPEIKFHNVFQNKFISWIDLFSLCLLFFSTKITKFGTDLK